MQRVNYSNSYYSAHISSIDNTRLNFDIRMISPLPSGRKHRDDVKREWESGDSGNLATVE
ncbi:hypothetical protein PbJCM13498_03460 [Prolixibacter bellariivorans]|uniref:Uncharacterized protein n=1 Tax=Prolixibacter bellariivorans TaxID=314319 RepID=A0A5M4AV11_9BACT|nr:hypothetical protein PbJCM13498_03460 [Prolixibacter bellariivorans]